MSEPVRFHEGDYVSDGTREGFVTHGKVFWVGGGTDPLTLDGLRASTETRISLAMKIHNEAAIDHEGIARAREALLALQSVERHGEDAPLSKA